MRLEGQHAERHRGAGGMRGPDHLRMSPMHAIEIAQRDGGATGISRQIAPVVEDAHQDRDGTWT